MSMTESEKVKKWFDSELSMRPEESLDSVECEEVKEICLNAIEEKDQYRAIGTVSEFRELKEKAKAKKQGNIHDLDSHLRLSKSGFVCCGATNKEIRYPLISFNDLEYCPRCGQHLDWSEGKE